MAFTSAQLASEITNDPKTLGLPALATAKNRTGIANALNAANTASVGVSIWRTDVASAEVLGALVYAEVAALTAAQLTILSLLIMPNTVIDASNANIRGFFTGLFAPATATRANLIALAKSALSSRAEELWGYGTRITEQDVANAGVS